MAMGFSTVGDGTFRPVAIDPFGMPVEIAFLPDGTIAERRTIPESFIEGMKKQAAAEREAQPRGSMRGNTQRHSLKVFDLPKPLAAMLQRRFGPFRKAKKEWLRWIENEGQCFLTSQYRLSR
jgi:hypothetical protein